LQIAENIKCTGVLNYAYTLTYMDSYYITVINSDTNQGLKYVFMIMQLPRYDWI